MRLLNERLKAILLADMAYDENSRGHHFPHPTAEEHAIVSWPISKEHQSILSYLLAL
jgi:hypothetical protein